MSVNREDAVHIGYGKDEMGFRCSVLEVPETGRRYLAYDVDVWWERAQHIKRLEAIGKRDQTEAANAQFIPLE